MFITHKKKTQAILHITRFTVSTPITTTTELKLVFHQNVTSYVNVL